MLFPVGYSLAKNNLNNTYQYNMISKIFSKTMNYVLNYINKIQSESFFVPIIVFKTSFERIITLLQN
jgi:disulfide oxidoreductase YuzD